MLFLTDGQGIIHPFIFLVVALGILFFTYKKHTKWVWLAVIPILSLFLYQQHVDETLVDLSQERYVTERWYDLYSPEYMSMTAVEGMEGFDTWSLETEGGAYILRFNDGESDGFEMVRTTWETEPLRARHNALEITALLELEGYLVFSEDHYTLVGNEDEVVIELTDDDRVLSVTDADDALLYQLKDEEGGTK